MLSVPLLLEQAWTSFCLMSTSLPTSPSSAAQKPASPISLVMQVSCRNHYLSNSLLQILRQIIAVANPRDSLEIGLSTNLLSREGISCIIDFTHRSYSSTVSPSFKSPIFIQEQRLLNANFSNVSLQNNSADIQKFQLEIPLKSQDMKPDQVALSAEEEAFRQPYPSIRLASEPSLADLSSFAETLRSKKVALHASSSTTFAQYLTTNLTAWGMEITHLSTEKGDVDPPPHSESDSHQPFSYPRDLPRFIIIDDDIEELRRRTNQLRRLPLSNTSSKRPPLVHRPKSQRGPESSLPLETAHPPTIIYFTSLTNYKVVRDFVQTIDAQSLQSNSYTPEVFALPKPVGPRRFLTAMYTAANKPLLDPLFAPIATCPTTPPALSPFTDSSPNKTNSTPDSRSRSDKLSGRSPRETIPGYNQHVYLGSPLAMEMETADYFPETDVHVLGQTPSSGMLIQSPDGQPAGIFFQPPASRHHSANSIGMNLNEKETSPPQRARPLPIDTMRRSTRHFSDELLSLKQMPHPVTFLRSKTTSQIPGPSNLTPSASLASDVHRRRLSNAPSSDGSSSRGESTREVPQTQVISEDEHHPNLGTSKARIKSPRTKPSMMDRKTSTSTSSNNSNSKMTEKTIVPPINVLIVEGDFLSSLGK